MPRDSLATGAAVIAGAVVLPVTIPLIVGGLGFGTTGIAAGSWAASFIASYGGAVTAGSACAILQSIGASGLGITGNAIAATVGVAIAGVVTTVTCCHQPARNDGGQPLATEDVAPDETTCGDDNEYDGDAEGTEERNFEGTGITMGGAYFVVKGVYSAIATEDEDEQPADATITETTWTCGDGEDGGVSGAAMDDDNASVFSLIY